MAHADHPEAELRAPHSPPARALRRVRRTLPLRRRILAAIVSATVLGVVLFAIPLAVAVQQLYRGDRIARLQRDAARVAAVAPEAVAEVPPTVVRPPGISAGIQVGIYRSDGHRVSGAGPAISHLAAAAGDGNLHDGNEAGRLAVAAPVPSDGVVHVTVRVAMAMNDPGNGVVTIWVVIAAIGAAAVLVAAFLARRQAHAIALPLEHLTAAATALGAGELPAPLPPSGIVEVDAAAGALQRTAARLDTTLRRQRAFSRDVSHQLRTPLTALMLGLESALARPNVDLRVSLDTAVGRLRQLQDIVEELLVLAEPDVAANIVDFQAVGEAVRLRWQSAHTEQGRRLDVHIDDDLPPVRAAETAVRQILDVLVGNALQHGAGTVAVTVRRLGAGVAVDVTDEGPGFDPDLAPSHSEPSRGHGVPLARSLAQLAGGSLVVESAAPQPLLRLLLPASRSGEIVQESTS